MTTEADDARALHQAWRGWLAEVDRIRSEAVAARNAEIAEAVRGLIIRDAWEGDEATGKVHDHIDGECGFRAAVLALVDRP